MLNPRFLTLSSMIGFAAVARLAPHPWNFTPISAMALFAGAHFDRKPTAFLVPLAALFLSDLVIGFYKTMPVVYASFALIVVIGFMLQRRSSIRSLAAAALVSALSFFLITNLADWFISPLYPKTFAGLMMSYTAGIPYFRNMILGDAFYTALLFGAFRLMERKFPILLPLPTFQASK